MSLEINMLETNVSYVTSEGKWISGAERVLQGIVAAAILFIMGLTFTDVFMRYVVSSPIKGGSEMVQFAMAVLIFAAFPLVTYHDKHINVSILHGKLRGVSGWLHRLVILLFNVATCFAIAWQLAREGHYLSISGMSTMVLGWSLAPLSYVMCALSVVSGLAALTLTAAHIHGFRRSVLGRSV
ncbi:TRAP transporter small permease [Paraburkholderia domus]|uniref:TRAP transporter small permease n=1 Tax=Paraburkholderia domus TaxID=2793075 RepID=UPI001B2AD323|nr:TRAP transporter small permease [Paraburkholderia domus]CAE6822464.1 hypothetical protein R75483_06313 [Paraburkholderia domus]